MQEAASSHSRHHVWWLRGDRLARGQRAAVPVRREVTP
jgi:hypothetical protein